ncbi:hypothetical protein NEOKW01_1327 [Nematocida sp. AWRm80]|nr:hypothetical protein NEOKW01_1327 [Nematocida sp. AWRm80]
MKISCKRCRSTIGISTETSQVHKECKSLILEGIPEGITVEDIPEGRIKCTKCNTNIGRYIWKGAKCKCNKWIFPYISIHLASIDIL